jgi:charged multivesicular body protein 7
VLGQPGFSNKLNTGDFVVLSNLEPAATDILEQISTVPFTVDRIMSKTEFLKRFGKVLNSETSLSATDLDILLVHLARDKQAISYNKHTIKFKSPTDPEPSPITQDDISIAGLRDQIANLRAQSESITQKVAAADAEVRDAITKKQHARAKAALRSKKLAESALQHRTDVALQLEGLYAQLEQAADMVGVVAAMKAGGTALKSLNQELGGAEGVAEVVDAVREEMAKTDEITDIINESSQPIDELEIDDELEALERAEKEKKEQQEKAAREKREQEAAAKTAARLQELEQLEKERKEKDQLEDQKPEEQKQESSQSTSPVQQLANGNLNTSFSQMSFEEKSQADTEEEAERVPMAA